MSENLLELLLLLFAGGRNGMPAQNRLLSTAPWLIGSE